MAGGNAGLFGGQGPVAYVNNLYAPQQQQLATQQAARTGTLQQLVQSILANLSQPRPDVYGAAAQDATSAANGAAQTLQGLNPNDSTQAMLRAIGAPQAQQAQVGNQNAQTFTGGAALDQYLGGALPAGVFAQDAAARNTYLNSLPAMVGQSAIQGLGRLQLLASQENSQLASNKAQSLQTARTDLAKFVQGNQKIKQAAAKEAFNEGIATTKVKNQVDEFNAKQTFDYQKLAQQTLQQNRMYGLDLQKLGVSRRSLQLRAAAQQLKLQNGGFSVKDVTRFKTDAQYVIGQAKTAQTTPDYQSVMEEMLKRHVPISIAQAAIKAWNPTLQGTPITPSLMKMYNQTVGVGTKPLPLDVAAAAKSFLGTPYRWGGTTSKGMDCSAFIQAVYRRVGVPLARTTYAQVKQGQPVSLQQLQPGDAIFTEPGKNGPNHVGLYIGNGMVQESPHTGDVNKIIPLTDFLSGGFVAARRYLP